VDGLAILEAIAGGLLLFFVPGFALSRAVFPEWRLRGPGAALRQLETVTLAFVLSVTLTVLVGVALLDGTPAGFAGAWSDPVLEGILAGIAAVAFGVGWARGAYRAGRAEPAGAGPLDAGEFGAWELDRELEDLARQERRIVHALRVRSVGPPEAAALRDELERVRSRQAELGQAREAEYATP